MDVIYILLEAVYCTKYLMQVPNRVLCKTVEKHLTDKAKLVRSLSNDGGLIIYMILAALSTCSSSIHMIIFCAACLISVVTLILPEIEPYLVFLTQILCISISKNVAVDCFLLGESSEDLFFFLVFLLAIIVEEHILALKEEKIWMIFCIFLNDLLFYAWSLDFHILEYNVVFCDLWWFLLSFS